MYTLKFFGLIIITVSALMSCGYDANKYLTPIEYDLNHPVMIELHSELNEISGIVYYPKDTSIFAISDANGALYKIFPNRRTVVQKWKFGKNHDYEDLQLLDSAFYILSSKGDIVKITFQGGSLNTKKFEFPGEGKNEFETLYYDSTSHVLNMICKDCKSDKKDKVSIWSFNPADNSFVLSPITLDVSILEKQFNKKKLELKPSAAAINPITNELYILSSINKVLVVADKIGNIQKAYPLNPAIYKQPEGIAFTQTGDLLISNESADEGSPNIMIIKY